MTDRQIIKGWASTDEVDRNQVETCRIMPHAFDLAECKNIPIFHAHLPATLGQVTHLEYKTHPETQRLALWMEGVVEVIGKSQNWTCLSVGFDVLEYEIKGTGAAAYAEVRKARLHEISIVRIGADENAVIVSRSAPVITDPIYKRNAELRAEAWAILAKIKEMKRK